MTKQGQFGSITQQKKRINDDFGLNYLPNAGGSEVQTHMINESDMEIG